MNEPVLWYFADPMCSWCWGFSPVIERLKAHYTPQVNVALVLGGLRPFTREPLTESVRQEILHHWHQVHSMTGQSFSFDGAMPPGFVYDTEPPSRAVVAAAGLNGEITFDYFKALQRAFYVAQQDITQESVLLEVLKCFLGDEGEQQSSLQNRFLQILNSDSCRKKTEANFQKSRQFGVRGFPTLILQTASTQDRKQYHLITSGYRPYETVQAEIDACLADVM